MNGVTYTPHTPRQPCRSQLAFLLLVMATVFGLARADATAPPTLQYKNGDTYVGETLQGERHGQGTYTFQDGKQYVGTWQHGLRHGQGTLTFPNGDTYAGGVRPWHVSGPGDLHLLQRQ